MNKLKGIASLGIAAISLVSLAACNGNNDSELSIVQGANDSTISLSPPPLLMTRAVNVQALEPRVTVNGDSITMREQQDNPGRWSGSTVVPRGTDTTVEVLWTEQFGPRTLPLASVTRDLGVVNNNTTTTLGSDTYIYDIHDDDDDGFSNISERINDTDPYDPLQPGSQSTQVFIGQIDPADAPIIDGQWDTNSWPFSQFRDRNRVTLHMNNLMIDQGATLQDGEPSYRWGAMHDGENLYLMMFAESVLVGQTPFSDSLLDYEDDAIDIFIDGDNSKGTEYDAIEPETDHYRFHPVLNTQLAVATPLVSVSSC